ncbi:hypothetical protein J2S19_001451 [Metabacillus malikii]|uniref:Uncharacterized protein n=1 Tax=Metabacillus malikii TaxID=1504265 RepID=A0ABT9ZD65_9BACI|nr:hypothetical protein [Metabacillus malikii]
MDMRKNLRFYKPFSIDTIVANLLEPLTKSINLLDTAKLPFEVDEEQAYLITSKDENGSIKHQLQLSYLSKTEYDDIGNFYIVSITEVDENPLKGHQILEKRDSIGNELKTYNLTNTLPIYQQIITTNSALLYKYYDYDIDNKKVVTVGTSANELYTYYNGAIYHIGYSINDEKANPEFHNEMLQLTREFILADTHHDM